MPREMTVLVLGAGSSAKFGLPLGSKLKSDLSRALKIEFQDRYNQSSGSHEILNALKTHVRKSGSTDVNPFRHAAIQISSAMPLAESIDEYIERHRADEKKVLCAKLGISHCILKSEVKSKLKTKFEDHSSVDLSGSWLAKFMNLITKGKSKEELKASFNNLVVINFNYDRCFEQFSYIWLQKMYELSAQESAALCIKMKIFHPYGRLGSLPFEGLPDPVPYGAELQAIDLLKAASRIRTYAEANDEAEEVVWLEPALMSARRFIFLGFAFHEPNLQICSPKTPGNRVVRCYASVGDEISAPRAEAIGERIRSLISIESSFSMSRGDCEKFWDEFDNVPLS